MIPIAFDIAKPFIKDIELDSKEFSKVINNFLSIKNSILMTDLSLLAQYMAESKHKNLRTFQFYLSKIEVLYEAISQMDNQAKEKFFRYILRHCFKIYFLKNVLGKDVGTIGDHEV
jgi:hypothetical protein